MKASDQINILEENLKALRESVYWLKRSYQICSGQFHLENLPEEGYDAFESLTARFARTVDILTNKVYRSIVYLEEGTSFSWLDTLLYLEKQELLSSIDRIRMIKELRNEIVHEYTAVELKELFAEVLNACPELFTLIEKSINHADQLLIKLRGK